MAKWANDAVMDAALDYVSTNATELYLCSGGAAPADRTAARAASLIDTTTPVSPSFSANANGDVSGRKVTVQQVTDEAITASGDATHIALCSGTTLIYVTTCTTQTLTSGGTVTIPAWDIEIEDPA